MGSLSRAASAAYTLVVTVPNKEEWVSSMGKIARHESSFGDCILYRQTLRAASHDGETGDENSSESSGATALSLSNAMRSVGL